MLCFTAKQKLGRVAEEDLNIVKLLSNLENGKADCYRVVIGLIRTTAPHDCAVLNTISH